MRKMTLFQRRESRKSVIEKKIIWQTHVHNQRSKKIKLSLFLFLVICSFSLIQVWRAHFSFHFLFLSLFCFRVSKASAGLKKLKCPEMIQLLLRSGQIVEPHQFRRSEVNQFIHSSALYDCTESRVSYFVNSSRFEYAKTSAIKTGSHQY